MQTFLPLPSYIRSAQALDSRRLGNQCYRETLTILRGGWTNHPASRMWRGHEYELAAYGRALAVEMRRRGGWRQEVTDRWINFYNNAMRDLPRTPRPPWFGNSEFHRAHQSNLIRKDPEHYGQLFPGVPDNLPYIWPEATV